MASGELQCRWCSKGPLRFWNERFHHATSTDQKECPNPFPFEDQIEGMVTMSLKDPDLVCHHSSTRCVIEYPHRMNECKEFTVEATNGER